jgi:hypothetical protein
LGYTNVSERGLTATLKKKIGFLSRPINPEQACALYIPDGSPGLVSDKSKEGDGGGNSAGSKKDKE